MVAISNPRAKGRERMPRRMRRCLEVRTPAKKPAEGDEVRDDLSRVVAEDGDAEEDDVAGHGVGEDMAMVEVDDGVEQATGGGQKHGVGERVGLDGGVVGRHGGWRDSRESIVKRGFWMRSLAGGRHRFRRQ